MTGSTSLLAVEWARWGMDPDKHRGYHVLTCSQGRFSRDNFKEILDRFSPGGLDGLPQVTVSYVRARDDGSRYLGMAIHEAEVSWDGRLGRDAMATRYFCVSYPEAAAPAVSYVAMYEAFSEIRPTGDDRSVRTVRVADAAEETAADGARALQVASLLLTGNPVCIVGAEATEMASRLAYIDAVMALLPYGMRAEMAASTWTRSTYRGHRFRLFFSDAPRRSVESGFDDHVVRWHADRVEVLRAPRTRFPAEPAARYLNVLGQGPDAPALRRLAGDTEPGSYNDEACFRALRHFEAADVDATPAVHATGERRPHRRHTPRERRPPDTGRYPRAPHATAATRAEELLLACVEAVGDASRNVRQPLGQLDELLETAELPSAEQRRRLHGLFGTSPRLMRVLSIGKQRASLYQFLVRFSLSQAIDYQGYCLIEDTLGDSPGRALLAAIDERAAGDPVVRLLVSQHRGEQRPAGLRQLARMAADPDVRPAHARIICYQLLDELESATASDIEDVRPLLRQHGYLAPALSVREPGDLQYQVDVLTSLLAALFPESPGSDPYRDVLARSGHAPTAALLLAVLCLTDESAASVGFSFMAGLAAAAGVGDDVLRALAARGVEVNAIGKPADSGTSDGMDESIVPFGDGRRDSSRGTRSVIQRLLTPRGYPFAAPREDYAGEEG